MTHVAPPLHKHFMQGGGEGGGDRQCDGGAWLYGARIPASNTLGIVIVGLGCTQTFYTGRGRGGIGIVMVGLGCMYNVQVELRGFPASMQTDSTK